MPEPHDNIVFIFPDQHRADAIGAAGEPAISTPNLDRLAAEGVMFRRAYCQSPVCQPSRTSLFCGRYPHQHGILGNNATLWPDDPCFVRNIRDAGLHTAVFGKLHYTWRHDLDMLVSHPLLWQLGFEDPHEIVGKCSAGNLRSSEYSEFLRARGLLYPFYKDLLRRVAAGPDGQAMHGPSILPEDAHIDAWVGDRSAEWLAQHDGRPFFLWVGPFSPHNPFDPPEPYASQYLPEDMRGGVAEPATDPTAAAQVARFGLSTSDRGFVQEMRSQYYGCVSLVDNRVGRILAQLEARNWLEHTWVIYSSDHGELLGDHGLLWKSQFYEAAARVPLIIRPPDRLRGVRRGVTCDALVELLDLTATMLDIAGTTLAGQQGKSLLPLVNGAANPDRHRRAVFSEIDQRLMVRTDQYKLVLTAATLEPLSLWDLQADPDEIDNLVLRPEAGAIIATLVEDEVRPFLARTPRDMGDPWRIVVPWKDWPRNPNRPATFEVPA